MENIFQKVEENCLLLTALDDNYSYAKGRGGFTGSLKSLTLLKNEVPTNRRTIYERTIKGSRLVRGSLKRNTSDLEK